jgi:hypothetical protein
MSHVLAQMGHQQDPYTNIKVMYFLLYIYTINIVVFDDNLINTFLLFQTDAHNYKTIGILKQLKFRLSLRHVSVHAGTIIREPFRA